MKITKYISFIAIILCAFILLCACANPDNSPADNSGNPPSNNATDESLPPEATAEDSTLPEATAEDSLPPEATAEDSLPPEATAEDSTPPDTSPEISLPDTQETQPEDTLPEYESGEYPPNFAGLHFWYNQYEFQVGQITDEFKMARLTEGIFYDPQKASFEVTSENPDIVEIISYNPTALMDYQEWGGITVQCHKPGVSKIYVTITYLPTGGTRTIEATVTVIEPTETTE